MNRAFASSAKPNAHVKIPAIWEQDFLTHSGMIITAGGSKLEAERIRRRKKLEDRSWRVEKRKSNI